VRVLLDTKVLLAAFGTRGVCSDLLTACLEGHEIVSSEHILGELRRHLTRTFRMPARQADEIVAFAREHFEIVSPAGVDPAACRDPDDLPVLGAAVAGRADLLVTGDKDLLHLHRHEGIPIVTPRECYARMVATGGR
jgi:putative PIN family toxin of toxin-antitoxin system